MPKLIKQIWFSSQKKRKGKEKSNLGAWFSPYFSSILNELTCEKLFLSTF